MTLSTLSANYANFNLWANQTLVQWLKTKPTADLTREVPSSNPSLVLTLDHIWLVERFWYRVVTKWETPYDPLETPADPAPQAVLSRLLAQSAELAQYVSQLSPSDFEEVISLDSPWVKGSLPRYEFLQHVVNHSTYHRGQVITIGRQLGYTDAPMTDYNFYNMVAMKRG